MKNFSISKLARTILDQRKRLGLTQQELADKAGINRSMLCRLENQEYVPSLDQLTRLANTLQFDVADVFIEYNTPMFNPVVPRNITVYGAGYAGLSAAVQLARHHRVILADPDPEKAKKINRRVSPLRDELTERYFARAELNLTAVTDGEAACRDADLAVIAVPAECRAKKGSIDTSAVDAAVETVLKNNPAAVIVIRSAVPVGYTAAARERYSAENILYSPDFIREASPLYDSLHPGRIVVGCGKAAREKAQAFADILKNSALKRDTEILITGSTEAEAIRLFSDACLEMRTAFFNDVDTYAGSMELNAGEIIRGICLDPRIGSHGSNPSFGSAEDVLPEYAGYMPASCGRIPRSMAAAVAESRRNRAEYIADRALELAGIREDGEEAAETKAVIGIFRPLGETDPGSFRKSPVREIMRRLRGNGTRMIVYEPSLEDGSAFFGCRTVNDLRKFKKQSSAILAERYDACLDSAENKVFTRDLSPRE